MKQIILITALLLAACSTPAVQNPLPDEGATTTNPDEVVSSAPGDTPMPVPQNPYAPRPMDAGLERNPATIDSAQLLTMESYPLQFSLTVTGSLPDPCHSLRAVISAPDAENKISINLYSVRDPTAMCVQMIEPFEANLALGSFPAGHYTVWVNGSQVAEFDA